MSLSKLKALVARMDGRHAVHVTLVLMICGLSILTGPLLLLLFAFGFYGWKRIGLGRPKSWIQECLLGLALGLLIFTLTRLFIVPWTDALGSAFNLKEGAKISDTLRGNVGAYLELMLLSVTTAGFLEEFLFRGYLMNRLADWLPGPKLSWVLSTLLVSAIFGLHHLIGEAGSWRTVIFAFLVSLLLSWAYVFTKRRLWSVMIAHAFYDAVVITLAFLGWLPGLSSWISKLWGLG